MFGVLGSTPTLSNPLAPPPDPLNNCCNRYGSVALDGVSLTPIDVHGDEFSVALIPHTLQATQFHQRKPGDRLNLEADVLARYLQRQLEARR